MNIKILYPVLITGKKTNIGDIVDVPNYIAHDLIHRQKAEVAKEKEVKKEEPNKEHEQTGLYSGLNYQELMKLVKEKGLSDKLKDLDSKKAPDIIALLEESDKNIPEFYEKLEEFKLMAKELKIEHPENITKEELEQLIEEKLLEDGDN